MRVRRRITSLQTLAKNAAEAEETFRSIPPFSPPLVWMRAAFDVVDCSMALADAIGIPADALFTHPVAAQHPDDVALAQDVHDAIDAAVSGILTPSTRATVRSLMRKGRSALCLTTAIVSLARQVEYLAYPRSKWGKVAAPVDIDAVRNKDRVVGATLLSSQPGNEVAATEDAFAAIAADAAAKAGLPAPPSRSLEVPFSVLECDTALLPLDHGSNPIAEIHTNARPDDCGNTDADGAEKFEASAVDLQGSAIGQADRPALFVSPVLGTNRWRLTPPFGEGLERTDDRGIRWHRDRWGIWRDQSESERGAAIDAAMSAAKDEWRASQAPGAISTIVGGRGSMEVARRIVLTVLGRYLSEEEAGGRSEPPADVIEASAPALIDARALFMEHRFVRWAKSAFYLSVIGEKPAEWPRWAELSATLGQGHQSQVRKLTRRWMEARQQGPGGPSGVASLQEELAPTVKAIKRHRPSPSKVPYDLNPAIQAMREGRHCYIDAPGGAGKTYTLRNVAPQIDYAWIKPKTFLLNIEVKTIYDRNYNVVRKWDDCFSLDNFDKLIEEAELAEADGYDCLIIIDEVQRLSLSQLKKLKFFSQIIVAGDRRQSTAGGNVQPALALMQALDAYIHNPPVLWRSQNERLSNAMSSLAYDDRYIALKPITEELAAPLFSYALYDGNPEQGAAFLWAMVREHLSCQRKESILLVLEDDLLSQTFIEMFASDTRNLDVCSQVQLTTPTQIAGLEADIIIIIPDQMCRSCQDEDTVRFFVTLLGRAKQQFWLLIDGRQQAAPPFSLFQFLLSAVVGSEVRPKLPGCDDWSLPEAARTDGYALHQVAGAVVVTRDGQPQGYVRLSLEHRAENWFESIAYLESRGWPRTELKIELIRNAEGEHAPLVD